MSDRNTRLMRDMGSKSGAYNPESEDWCLWDLNHSRDMRSRLIAYLKSKTTALGHHSPYAVDAKTKLPITLRRLADDLGWDIENARKEMKDAETDGIVYVDDLGRYWLRADIPAARSPKGSPKPSVKPVEKVGMYRLLPPCLHEEIQQLTKPVRDRMERAAEVAIKWGIENLEADAVAAARITKDEIESSILAIGGLEKKNGRRAPEDRARLVARIELAVPLPDFQFVQTGEQFVQTANGGLYNGKNGSAHTGDFRPDFQAQQQPVEKVKRNGNRSASSDSNTDKDLCSSSKLSAPSGKTEEEENRSLEKVPEYSDFKDCYPPRKLDDAQASRLFECLPPVERLRCMRGLIHHLGSERWVESIQRDGARFVPLASRFIKNREYAFDPPPYIPQRKDVETERSMEVLRNLERLWGG